MILSRRRALATVGSAVLAPCLSARSAQAQLLVEDPRAILQAVQQVRQGLAQIQALQAQLAQQERMLQSLGADVSGPLRDIAGQATQLLQQARGLGYQAADITKGFAELYSGDLNGLSPKDLAARLEAWGQASRQTLQEAMQVQSQIARSQPATAGAVAQVVAASQSAAGQTAAVQATNQLLAGLSTQLTQLQTLLITQARQTQTWEAERRALVDKGEADRQRASVLTPGAPRFSGDVLQ